MIISFSGKKQSGKDLAGRITQYLLACENNEISKRVYPTFEIFDKVGYGANQFNWERKQFAGKVKLICSILTGIPVEDMEKEEVKNKVLGEEWIRYGYADSFYRDMNNIPIMNNKQCSKEEYLEHVKTNFQTAYKHEYTVRELLQLVGTNAIRNIIHTDAWVNALLAEYRGYYSPDADNVDNTEDAILFNKMKYPNWIITDVRFPNEAKAIKDRGGFVIRLVRKQYWLHPDDWETETGQKLKRIPEHESETALDNYEDFDLVIDNNYTIQYLIDKIELFLHKQNLLK